MVSTKKVCNSDTKNNRKEIEANCKNHLATKKHCKGGESKKRTTMKLKTKYQRGSTKTTY